MPMARGGNVTTPRPFHQLIGQESDWAAARLSQNETAGDGVHIDAHAISAITGTQRSLPSRPSRERKHAAGRAQCTFVQGSPIGNCPALCRTLMLILLLMVVTASGCGFGGSTGGRPTQGGNVEPDDDGNVIDPAGAGSLSGLDFEASPGFCCDPLRIAFQAVGVEESVLARAALRWDFGDGRTGQGPVIHHVFDFPGEYSVVLRAKDGDDAEAEVRRTLVLGFNDGGTDIVLQPPDDDQDSDDVIDPAGAGVTAEAGADQIVTAGESVALDGRGSEGESALTYSWNQGLGPAVTLSNRSAAVTQFTAPDAPDGPVLLVFRLTVRSGDAIDSDDVIITVTPAEDNIDPLADLDSDGLPHGWEVRFFGGEGIYDGLDDPDWDGLSNREEFEGKTDPTQRDTGQIVVNTLLDAARAFRNLADGHVHTVDGRLVGWARSRTVDGGAVAWRTSKDTAAEYVDRAALAVTSDGTAGVGHAMLRLYEVTGNREFLIHAAEAANSLLSVQRDMERFADGSLRARSRRGGWIDGAVVLTGEDAAAIGSPAEAGHWSLSWWDDEADALEAGSRDEADAEFDDGVSIDPAMFLIELHEAMLAAGGETGGAGAVDAVHARAGAGKLLALAEGLATDVLLLLSDFAELTLTFAGAERTKDGPHPFVAYLGGLPEHPLARNEGYRPYATGGLPRQAGAMDRLLVDSSEAYGARAGGSALHRRLAGGVQSKFVAFLGRFLAATGDASAREQLLRQRAWLMEVFDNEGRRGWCEQYHALDDACAAGAPWEPPAIALDETVALVHRLGFVEHELRRSGEPYDPQTREMLEDALFYLARRAPRTSSGQLYSYAALRDYGPDDDPSAYPSLAADEPLFACDFYYPADPVAVCPADVEGLGHNLYSVTGTVGGLPADSWNPGLAAIDDGGIVENMIADVCLSNANLTSYRGCLDLDKWTAAGNGFWNADHVYWSRLPLERTVDWSALLPESDGLWSRTEVVRGQPRRVARTDDFVNGVLTAVQYLSSEDGVYDADSDGLFDDEEQQAGTDPHRADTDGDGLSDEAEVYYHRTNPLLSDTDGDGVGDAAEER